ncbi:MAG: threonylcarbamoyl-AMP synthase [Phycisphaerales bacterium]|nr:threonylcarbamoyl-AMP synthase [Phycisphaerales bacterium]
MVNQMLQQAADLLRTGGVVAFPTETVYGLGANALLPQAVARVFEIKNRPRFDPLIVHVPCVEDADRLVREFPPLAQQLAERFWPGPMTLVLPKRDNVPDLVTADLPTVAVRVPAHPMARKLLELAAVPVAAPSANPFGGISPTTAEHVRQSLGNLVDCIVDGGPCDTGLESTVIGFGDDGRTPMLLRPGGLSVEEVEAITGPLKLPTALADDAPSSTLPLAPGMLARHYAPETKLFSIEMGQLDQFWNEWSGRRIGLLLFEKR